MKKSLFRLLSVLALVLLLSNPTLSAQGARSGLILWAQAVLPALLPFMICSNVIVALNGIPLLIFPVKRLLTQFFSLSESGCYVLVSGLLCGYPMGVKTCSDFMEEGRIGTREASYLAAICNHPSPMFLMGYAASLFPKEIPLLVLLLSVYLPVLPIAYMAKKAYGITTPKPQANKAAIRQKPFDETLMASCDTMIKIGGYIMIFSILAAFVNRIPLEAPKIKAVLLSLIEITTGLQAVSVSLSGFLGGMVSCAALAFGGFSGIFQTKSVIKNAGLSIRHYVIWKGVHSILSCIIFILLMAARQVL